MVKRITAKRQPKEPQHKTRSQINKEYYRRKANGEEGIYKGKIYGFLRSLT